MKRYRWPIAFAAVVVLVLLCLAVARRTEPPPKPNGYDDFVAAGNMILGDFFGGFLFVDQNYQAAMATFAARNEPMLARVRLGLSKEARVPVGSGSDVSHALFRRAMAIHQVDTAMSMIAQQREFEGRLAEAVGIELDCIRLAIARSRGGMEMHYFDAETAEVAALLVLRRFAPRLDAPLCRQTLKALAATEGGREPMAVVRRREILCALRTSGWWNNLMGIKDMAAQLVGINDPIASLQGLAKEIIRDRRELSLALARRAFTLERGRPPATDAELVPAYLPALPPAAPPAK